MSCAGSVVLTQTHPAAPYVCRTGNITLRCQYDGVENVFTVGWDIGLQTTSNASTIPGHTALPRTSTYQEIVVDSYTNLATGYLCNPTFSNGSRLQSNTYIPQIERERQPNQTHAFIIYYSPCMQVHMPAYSNILISQVEKRVEECVTGVKCTVMKGFYVLCSPAHLHEYLRT